MLKEHGFLDLPILPSASLNGIESAEVLARQLLIVSEILVTQQNDSGVEMMREENEVYRGALEKSEHVIKNLKGDNDCLSAQLEQLKLELNQKQALFTTKDAMSTQRGNSKERVGSKERQRSSEKQTIISVGSPKSNWHSQLTAELKAKLRKAEDTIKHMVDEANRRLREVSNLKAENEQLRAQGKLSQTAGYVKMLKKLEKVAPRAHILVNMY